jgi:hypothetical protein
MLALRPALLEWFWTRTGVPQANRSQYSPHGLGGDGRSGVRTCHTPRSSRPRTPPRPCQKRLVIEAAWGAKPLPVAGGWPARRLNDQPFHAPIHGQRQPAVAARLRIALRPARDVVATLSQSDKEQWRHRASSVKPARTRDGTDSQSCTRAHLPTPRRRRGRLHGRRGHSRRCTAPHEVCWVRSDTSPPQGHRPRRHPLTCSGAHAR